MLTSNGFRALLSFLILVHVVRATEFLPCAYGTGPLPIDVIIDGCEKLPCRFQRGRNISSSVAFKSPCAANKLYPFFNVRVGSVWMNFDAGQKNGCDSLLDAKCPLREGDIYTYNYEIPVQKGYPKIRIKVEHEMVDHLRRPVFCYGVVGMVVEK